MNLLSLIKKQCLILCDFDWSGAIIMRWERNETSKQYFIGDFKYRCIHFDRELIKRYLHHHSLHYQTFFPPSPLLRISHPPTPHPTPSNHLTKNHSHWKAYRLLLHISPVMTSASTGMRLAQYQSVCCLLANIDSSLNSLIRAR